jgi:hypothetical protein
MVTTTDRLCADSPGSASPTDIVAAGNSRAALFRQAPIAAPSAAKRASKSVAGVVHISATIACAN